jgi:hypothetical protein
VLQPYTAAVLDPSVAGGSSASRTQAGFLFTAGPMPTGQTLQLADGLVVDLP